MVSLSLICGICGLLLAFVKSATRERIALQLLQNVQGPAVGRVLPGSDNDLLKDRKEVKLPDTTLLVFVGKKGAEVWSVAFESFAPGYGGPVGVVTGFDLSNDTLTGIGITSCTETPGLGLRVREPAFCDRFRGRGLADSLCISKDGGVIDAVSGATISSRAVCTAVRQNIKRYAAVKTALQGK